MFFCGFYIVIADCWYEVLYWVSCISVKAWFILYGAQKSIFF